MKRYRFNAGEHLAGVAAYHGFESETPIWNHGENAALRAKRSNPLVLAAGDEVAIPERETKTVACATERTHTFVLRSRPLWLRLVLQSFAGKPLAGATVEACLASPAEHTTSAGGELGEVIPPSLRSATLNMGGQTLNLAIGDLDPVDSESGLRGRLVNLGYLVVPLQDDDVDELAFAVQDFQADAGLPTTGEADAATRAKLVERHGC